MQLPEFHLPEINFGGLMDWVKSHLLVVIGGAVVIVGAIGGFIFYQNYQAKLAAEAAANIDYSIKPLTLDQLQGGNYYIKDGDTYYQVAPGLLGSTKEATTIPTMADPENRMVLFGPDDQQIPTLYKDTQLIYKASDFNNPNADGTVSATPTDYYLERFTDLGYSIGIVGLNNPDGTKYRTSVIKTHFYPNCSAIQNMKLKADAELIVDKINGMPINQDNVSSIGTVMGLAPGQTYTVDAYIGTSPVGGQVVADTHMFASFELYDLKDYELDAAGYAIVKIPDYMWSGYYYVNGMGLFRYVNGYKAYGVSADINYNTAYFMGKDQAGNLITNPAPSVEDPNTKATVTAEGASEESEEDPFTYHHKLTIDNQQRSMTVLIEYSEAMTYADTDSDGQYEVLKASSGVIVPGASVPSAVLVSPTGTKYTMTNLGAVQDENASSEETTAAEDETSQAANSLTATIESPELGTWSVDITGMYGRAFTISSSFAGSNTNMVVKDSSHDTSMTVYLPEAQPNAVFKFTWDEIGHTGTFKVSGPNGKEIVSNARNKDNQYEYPENVLDEQFGEVDLLIGEAPAGEYKIKISGESLGHVLWTCADVSDGESKAADLEEAPTEETKEEVKEK